MSYSEVVEGSLKSDGEMLTAALDDQGSLHVGRSEAAGRCLKGMHVVT